MSAEQNETLSRAAQSRGENMMIQRACEIFIDARKSLGNDLAGGSLVDLIADNADYPIDACRELAAIVVDRCVCSERLKEKYCDGVEIPSRLLELARIAYHGYGASVHYVECGESMPAWDELPDRIRTGWRGSVVELLLEYQAGNGSVQDPGETVKNSEHHFVAGEISGISMRLIEPAGEPGRPRRMIIERDLHGKEINAGVERLSLNQDEAAELAEYLTAAETIDFWQR